MSIIAMLAPAWASADAMPKPMPDPAPDTYAVFPLKSCTRLPPVVFVDIPRPCEREVSDEASGVVRRSRPYRGRDRCGERSRARVHRGDGRERRGGRDGRPQRSRAFAPRRAIEARRLRG